MRIGFSERWSIAPRLFTDDSHAQPFGPDSDPSIGVILGCSCGPTKKDQCDAFKAAYSVGTREQKEQAQAELAARDNAQEVDAMTIQARAWHDDGLKDLKQIKKDVKAALVDALIGGSLYGDKGPVVALLTLIDGKTDGRDGQGDDLDQIARQLVSHALNNGRLLSMAGSAWSYRRDAWAVLNIAGLDPARVLAGDSTDPAVQLLAEARAIRGYFASGRRHGMTYDGPTEHIWRAALVDVAQRLDVWLLAGHTGAAGHMALAADLATIRAEVVGESETENKEL